MSRKEVPPHAAKGRCAVVLTALRGEKSPHQAKIASVGVRMNVSTSSRACTGPVTIVSAMRSSGGLRVPHPATVAQSKRIPTNLIQRVPHPATVVSPRPAFAGIPTGLSPDLLETIWRQEDGELKRVVQKSSDLHCECCGEDGHSWKKCPLLQGAEDPEEKKVDKRIPEDRSKRPTKKQEQEAKEKAGYGDPVESKDQRPAEGHTLAYLQSIGYLVEKYPATIAATMANVGGASVGDIQVLEHNKGTVKETWECKVSAGGVSFVVHYHPNLTIPQGALSGESKLHVKGSRGAKHHENVPSDVLKSLGVTFESDA